MRAFCTNGCPTAKPRLSVTPVSISGRSSKNRRCQSSLKPPTSIAGGHNNMSCFRTRLGNTERSCSTDSRSDSARG